LKSLQVTDSVVGCGFADEFHFNARISSERSPETCWYASLWKGRVVMAVAQVKSAEI